VRRSIAHREEVARLEINLLKTNVRLYSRWTLAFPGCPSDVPSQRPIMKTSGSRAALLPQIVTSRVR
jgi:hypothetical protein